MSFTTKQIQIMTIVARGNSDPEQPWCDLDQVLERLASEFAWETTKQSIQFSIRTLVERGAMTKEPTEKRRGRRRVVLKPTQLCLEIAGPGLYSATPEF